jgi:HSP90 family molecular chaperone
MFSFKVFVRELISNSSDALEKLRYLTMRGELSLDKDANLEIHIAADDNKKTLTIQV